MTFTYLQELFRPEPTGSLRGKLAISISGDHRIGFKPANDPNPTKEDGELGWKQIIAMTVFA